MPALTTLLTLAPLVGPILGPTPPLAPAALAQGGPTHFPGLSPKPVLPTVPYALLAEQPATYVGKEVRLAFQFHSLEPSWNPFVTRFAPRRYVAVRGWADEQLPWIQGEFERTPVRVFVPRNTFLEGFFRLGERHERIVVTCVTREVFAGQPWIEVLDAEASFESIPEGTVLHVGRALAFEEQEAYGLALGELDRALAAPLPMHAYDALLEIKKRCLVARDKR